MIKKVKLSEICDLQNGYAFKSNDYVKKSNTLNCRMSNIRPGAIFDIEYNPKYLPDEYSEIYKDYLLNDGDIIIAMTDLAGDPKILGVPAQVQTNGKNILLNQRVGKLTIKDKNKIFYKYLKYALSNPRNKEYYKRFAGGGLQINISKKDILNIEIPLPIMKEQIDIADRLDKIQEIIDIRKKQIEEFDGLIKARFVELFGDPVSNPRGWETKRFDALCENLDSRRKPITASEREAGIYPYYGASGVVDYVADYLFDEDILLVSEDGANLLMRSTPIAFSVNGKVWVNNHAHVVRFEKMSMQKYIEVFFSMIDISEHITGSAQPKLNQAKLNAMMFPVPDDDRLEAFLSFVEQTDKSKLELQKSLEEMQNLFDSLMAEYFG